MFVQTLFAAALAASATMVSALPAKAQQQEIAAAPALALTSPEVLYTIASIDGTCGGETKYTCEGSGFGDCCSIYGFCGSTQAFCGTSCFSGAGLCDSDLKKQKSKAKSAAAVVEEPKADAPVEASATQTPPQEPAPVHTPWKPTPFVEHKFQPSYVIDNGERAPNQVWD